MKKLFQIGDFCFQIDFFDEDIKIPDNFLKFEVFEKEFEYKYEIMIKEKFPEINGQVITRRPDLLIYQTTEGEARLIGSKGIEGFYACYIEKSKNLACIYLNPKRLNNLNIDPVFTSLFALERRMIKRNQFVLHCAYIRYKNEAILFSAPSETGKTTQANLWEKYLGSKTINGDRSLLRKIEDQWYAQGWPVCGTSDACHPINTPIKAIVMLSQGKDNIVEKLSSGKAFSLLYSQITINKWNPKDHMKTIDLIDQLIQDIPIYHLSCTISKEAVTVLNKIIYE